MVHVRGGRVLHDGGGPVYVAFLADVLERRDGGTDDLLRCLDHTLQRSVSKPRGETSSQEVWFFSVSSGSAIIVMLSSL